MSTSSLQSNGASRTTSKIEPRWWFLFGMVAFGVCSRLLPHPDNFSPIAAVALFAGASFTSWRSAVAVPMATMLFSDLFLGLHWTMPLVYASICLNIVIGHLLVNTRQPWTIPACALIGSVQFFLITNIACLTEFSTAGVVQCYTAALPFFQNTLVGDLMYASILFGVLAIAQYLVPSLRTRTAMVAGR